jgi:hypothetical protein
MPFINALGYNVFDPTEVTPELIADVGIKNGNFEAYQMDARDKVGRILYFNRIFTSSGIWIHFLSFFSNFSSFQKIPKKIIFWFTIKVHEESAFIILNKQKKNQQEVAGTKSESGLTCTLRGPCIRLASCTLMAMPVAMYLFKHPQIISISLGTLMHFGK